MRMLTLWKKNDLHKSQPPPPLSSQRKKRKNPPPPPIPFSDKKKALISQLVTQYNEAKQSTPAEEPKEKIKEPTKETVEIPEDWEGNHGTSSSRKVFQEHTSTSSTSDDYESFVEKYQKAMETTEKKKKQPLAEDPEDNDALAWSKIKPAAKKTTARKVGIVGGGMKLTLNPNQHLQAMYRKQFKP